MSNNTVTHRYGMAEIEFTVRIDGVEQSRTNAITILASVFAVRLEEFLAQPTTANDQRPPVGVTLRDQLEGSIKPVVALSFDDEPETKPGFRPEGNG